jgi:prepilin-type N-terminal cleavage/methylation domain-containing protein
MKGRGFTLVELSIVLIIIGLIVGGVVAGQSMIHSAELNAVIKDIAKVKISMNMFRDKYDYPPGDMPNATDYWPSISVNGNGDGFIKQTSWYGESLEAWEHMKLAGFKFNCKCNGNDGSETDQVPGSNLPQSPFKDSGYWFRDPSSVSVPFENGIANLLQFGRENYTLALSRGSVNPADAKHIDNKMDDGIANSGSVFAETASDASSTCRSPASVYTLSNDARDCVLRFVMDY